MTQEPSHSGGRPRVLFWLVWLVFWCVGSLFIVGPLHRDNNYGLRPKDYQLRTMDATEFATLTAEQQAGWDLVSGPENYVKITIKNPFVFSHVLTQLFPILLFAIVALFSYMRWHGLPPKRSATSPG